MKIKNKIILVICMIFCVTTICQIDFKVLHDNSKHELVQGNYQQVLTGFERETKKPQSMLDNMREQGMSEKMIELRIESMERLGFDINDWVVAE